MRTFQELASMHGRVACVTGGAGRIGGAFCNVLAELGAEVCVLDISQQRADERAEQLGQRFQRKMSAVVADVASEDSVADAVEEILSVHGRLDALVNNAAYAPSDLLPDGMALTDQTFAQWKAQTAVILDGAFLMSKRCHAALAASGSGCIVNISSIYGAVGPDPKLYRGTSIINEAHYAASKGGIIQLTRYLATTLAPEVRVNCIAPGGLLAEQPDIFQERYTGRTPLGRMAKQEDLKGAMGFLASDLSLYMTGQTLFVDGGWTAW